MVGLRWWSVTADDGIHCDWQIWQNSENSQIFGFAAFKTNIYYKPQVLSYLLYNIHNKSIKI